MLVTGHGPLPQLSGNVSDVLVSSLLQSCYLSSQTLPRVYQHYGPSPIQPLSAEMQILLTVYYLVHLGKVNIYMFKELPFSSRTIMATNERVVPWHLHFQLICIILSLRS